MRKLKIAYALMFGLTCALLIPGCRKQGEKMDAASSSMDEIKAYNFSISQKLVNKPKILYELAQKTTVAGREYVRIPAIGSGGETLGAFYYTKSQAGALQPVFIVTNQRNHSSRDGLVSFIDFDHQTLTIGKYQQDKRVGLFSLKDTKSFFETGFLKEETNKKIFSSGCPESLNGIKDPTGANAITVFSGGIPCPGEKTFWQKLGEFFTGVWDGITRLFNFGDDEESGGSVALNLGYSEWSFSGFLSGWTNSGGTYSDDGTFVAPGGGGTWIPYFPPNNTEPEISFDETSDAGLEDNANSNSGDDSYNCPPISTSLKIVTITDIMGKENFVRRVSPKENCLKISRAQILKLSYKCNGWDPANTTFQIYTRAGGINQARALEGVSYLVCALARNIPVVIGVDYAGPKVNADLTTNHFVVVVGMGKETDGKIFFRFYDNFTSDTDYGASDLNKVVYDPATGALTGSFVGTRTRAGLSYKVSQIRKSFK